MKRNGKTIRQPLTRRLILGLLTLMAIMAAAISYMSYWALESTYMRLYNEKSQDLVRTLATEINGDLLSEYVETKEKDAYYAELQQMFDSAKANFTGIQYLYAYKPYADHLVYIVEGCTEKDDPAFISSLGDVFEYQEIAYKYLVPDIALQKPSTELITGPDQGYGKCIYSWAPVFDSNGSLVAYVEADCALSQLRQFVNSFAFPILAVLVAFIAVAIGGTVGMLHRIVILPLSRLTGFVRSYEHGTVIENLSDFKYDDEMRYMANSFQEMTVRIDKYIHDLTAVTAEKERIGAELNVATQIQADMLPRIFPPYPNRTEFDLYATMDPAKEVGGDFYDFFLVDDDHLAMVMADVSGKGVPAALFMVIAKTLLKNRTQAGGRPGEILRDVNNQLCEGNDAELFVTVWLGILELSTGHLVSASAGHEYPAFFRAEKGRFDLEKDKHGPPLATMEGLRFRETETDMAHGDAVFLYTDGVTEATSGDQELFGEERMVEALNQCSQEAPEVILPAVREKIDTFVGTAPQFDDITMLCVRYH